MKRQGKVAVITGGSRGIGLGCARVFARHGCAVVLAARGEEEGRAAEKELVDAGHQALFVRCLINHAGWHPPAMSLDETRVEDFERLLRLNLTSTFMGCKFAVSPLRRTRGNIINMSSEVALIG